MEKEYYDVKEFANKLGYHRDRIYEWVRRGVIAANRATTHSKYLIPKSELERLLKAGPREPVQIRKDVSPQQQIDRILIKAQEEHLSEIVSLLREWDKQLMKRPRVCLNYRCPIETYDVRFPYVLQHCPSVKDNYELLKLRRTEYRNAMSKLESKIAKDVPSDADELFIHTIAHYSVVSTWLVFEEIGNKYQFSKNTERNGMGELFALCDHGGMRTIASGDIEALRQRKDLHKQIVRNYMNTVETDDVVKCVENEREWENKMRDVIKRSLFGKEYVANECDLCKKLHSNP